VRGQYEVDVAISKFTWFRVGGPADVVFHPADEDDLIAFLNARSIDVPVTVIGLGANLLVRDGGIEGVVVRLGRAFAKINFDGESITAGGGTVGAKLALTAAEEGIAGLEFLSGIPGTIGGAICMNAGAYGRESADVVTAVRVVTLQGAIQMIDSDGLDFSYRHSSIDENSIVLSAQMTGKREAPSTIKAALEEICRTREATQPVRLRTGGSTFVNPEGAEKAWQLVERAGCRGLKRGDAMVSKKHCNFMINSGSATAADIEQLGDEVIAKVTAATGITLQWEIRRIGRALTRNGAKPARGSAA
jgi:UDP-N-acetylmuramate dehydrogenase